jgi:hypothetical protein
MSQRIKLESFNLYRYIISRFAFLLDVINNSSLAEDMYEHFDKVSPIACMYEQRTYKSYNASHVFKEFYLHNEPITIHSLTGLGNVSIFVMHINCNLRVNSLYMLQNLHVILPFFNLQLYSDAIIRYGQDLTSKLVSSKSKEPVFSYLFEYQGRYSHAYWPGTQNPYGKLSVKYINCQ